MANHTFLYQQTDSIPPDTTTLEELPGDTSQLPDTLSVQTEQEPPTNDTVPQASPTAGTEAQDTIPQEDVVQEPMPPEIRDTVRPSTTREKTQIVREPVPVKTEEPEKQSAREIKDTTFHFFGETNVLKRIQLPEYTSMPGNLYFEELSVKDETIQIREELKMHQQNWLFGLYFSLLLLLFFAKKIFNTNLGWIFQSVYNGQLFYKLYRDPNTSQRQQSFVLLFLYLIIVPLFLIESAKNYDIRIGDTGYFRLLLILSSALALYQVLRYIVMHMIGTVSLYTEPFKEYLFKTKVMNIHIGILLFPIVLSITYMPEVTHEFFILLGFAMIGYNIMMRIFRGLEILSRERILILYRILYLCILEILPVAILVKYVNSLI